MKKNLYTLGGESWTPVGRPGSIFIQALLELVNNLSKISYNVVMTFGGGYGYKLGPWRRDCCQEVRGQLKAFSITGGKK